MKGYTERKMIPPAVKEKFDLATRLVQSLGTLPDEIQEKVRCHELARAIAKTMYISGVVDGKYGHVEHSWIVLHHKQDEYNGVREKFYLDVYSCGRLPMVQVLDTFFGLKHASLYTAGPLREDIDQSMVDLLHDHLLRYLETAS